MSITEKSTNIRWSTQKDTLIVCTLVFMGYMWKKWCDLDQHQLFGYCSVRKRCRRRKRAPLLYDNFQCCWLQSVARKRQVTNPMETSKPSKQQGKTRQVRFAEANEIMEFDGEKRLTKRKGEAIRGILRKHLSTDGVDDPNAKDNKSSKTGLVSPRASGKESEYDSTMERYITLLAKKMDRSIRSEMDALYSEVQQIRRMLSNMYEKDWLKNSGDAMKKFKVQNWDRSSNSTSPSLSGSKKDLFLQSPRPTTRMEKTNNGMRIVTCLSSHLGGVRKVLLEPSELYLSSSSWSSLERTHFRIITASEDCTLKLWNLEAKKYAARNISSSGMDNSSSSSNSNLQSNDQLCLTTCESIHTYRGHLAPILSAQVFPDKTRTGDGLLVSGDAQGSLLFWDIPSVEETTAYMSHHQLSPFQRYVVTNVHEKECIWDICKPLDDSPMMATAGADGTVKLWDYSSFRWDDDSSSSPVSHKKYTQMEPLGVVRFPEESTNYPTVFGVVENSHLLVGSVWGILYGIDLKERRISNQWYSHATMSSGSHRWKSIYAVESWNAFQVLVGTSSGNVVFQDLRMEKPSQEIENGAGAFAVVTCIRSFVDNYWFACGGNQSMIRFWDIRKMDTCLEDLMTTVSTTRQDDKVCIWSLLRIPSWNCLLAATSSGCTFLCSKDI